MTVSQTIKWIKKKLHQYYPPTEISSIIPLVFEYVMQYSKTDIFVNHAITLPAEKQQAIKQVVEQLLTYKPIQYITGQTVFSGLSFLVSPAVLIPRPETEELVGWIVSDYQNRSKPVQSNTITGETKIKILDIATGSGCIAIALQHLIKKAQVDAFDISENALEIARQNSHLNHAKVNFFQTDILQYNKDYFSNKTYHIIVSNPPYVCQSAKKQMDENVIAFEPHQALFVSDSNPLLFYNAIANFAIRYLMPGGLLYFEINELYHNEINELLRHKPFTDIIIKKDLNGKHRMVSARLTPEKYEKKTQNT